jgi:hypothetical protein
VTLLCGDAGEARLNRALNNSMDVLVRVERRFSAAHKAYYFLSSRTGFSRRGICFSSFFRSL